MYYDDDMDYIYCLISKASCTSWKRTLMMLSGKIDRARFRRPEQLPIGKVHNHRNSDKYVSRVETLPQAERAWRFDGYFTFLFVREPLERLVSAYRDKVLVDPGYHVDVEIVRRLSQLNVVVVLLLSDLCFVLSSRGEYLTGAKVLSCRIRCGTRCCSAVRFWRESAVKLEFNGTDTDTGKDFRDAPIL